MKYKKTPNSERKCYTYIYVGKDGEKRMEYIVSGENGVTEKQIAQLHALDDKEVYNNLKNCRVSPTKRMRQDMKEWDKKHPNEDNPHNVSLYNISLDDMDAVSLSKVEYINATEKGDVPLEIERLREVVEKLSELDRKIYELVIIEEMSKSEAAKLLSITEGTVRYHLNYIIEFIRSNF